ncbi:DUF5330 domain-containing protein [Methylobrevis pamukkalensis]|uniref:DUF5330 domain-containing protein n=1 Tax=Methylobrevis pamukkalensis TaxID=1439726 RepID=A0A1E3H7U5_9HYPH|nr:DUF5330 domain-containing protein [Methylobrevis pamukkalensis]ODN72408.1 hypothetical protein A6302_00154 [Methylobrevis pamukkalensis]
MFLIRTLFWLTVVIALIPVNEQDVAASAAISPVEAGQAVYAAQAAVSDLGGFCERNPSVCEIGGRIASTMALKAKAGARYVYEYLETETGDGAATGDTLTEADRLPGWRGAADGREA